MSIFTDQLQEASRLLLDMKGHGSSLPAYQFALYNARLDYWQRYQHQPDIGPPPHKPARPNNARQLEKQRRRALGHARQRKLDRGPIPERRRTAYIFSELMERRHSKNRYRRENDIALCREMIKRKHFTNCIPRW